MLSLSTVGKPEERGLPGAEPQVGQVYAAVCRQDAAVGAEGHRSLSGQRRVAQLQHHRLLRPVKGSQVTLALIPDPQVRQGRGGVREEDEVPEQQGALFTSHLAHTAEKTATGQTFRSLLLYTERGQDQYAVLLSQYYYYN